MPRFKQQKQTAMEYTPPYVPLKRGMLRDPKHVQSVIFRMGKPYIKELDKLCEVNKRTRREIVEILIAEAAFDLYQDPDDRISPL